MVKIDYTNEIDSALTEVRDLNPDHSSSNYICKSISQLNILLVK